MSDSVLKRRVKWLMKTEPDVYSFQDLQKQGTTPWEGVRNYQARNFMMQEMKLGDLVFVYHSNASPSGIVGIAEVVKSAEPDTSALDSKSEYFDPKSSAQKPRWYAVTIGNPKPIPKFLSLAQLREMKLVFSSQSEQKRKDWDSFALLSKGSRLSIVSVPKLVSEDILSVLERK
jgi:predicted RNA-binding protein with PUA-like domain